MNFVPRNISGELVDALRTTRAVALLGPRQAGKSTLAQSLRWAGVDPGYYTLDDDGLRAVVQDDPYGFITAIDRPAVIDEIQRVPSLMLAIKRTLDENPMQRGQFLLTGSADLLAIRQVADALPGRVEYVNLWPFAQAELSGKQSSFIDMLLAGEPPNVANAAPGRASHAERLIAGGFPEAREMPSDRRRSAYFESYVRSAVSRELPDIGAVRTDPVRVDQLLRLLAARTGGAVNFTRLGCDLNVSDNTVKAHLELLEQMYLVVRLRPWSTNFGTRQVRASKFYLADSGLASSLAGVDAARYLAIDQGPIAGMLLETFVVTELVKTATWSKQVTRLYYYRDNHNREVDVVIESNSGDLAAVEVKSATAVRSGDTRGLRLLRDKTGNRFKSGVVLYIGEHTIRLDDRIWAVPVEGLW